MKNQEKLSNFEEENEERLRNTYALGQSVGLERAGNMLLEDAAGHYRNGRDDAAALLRQFGQRLLSLAILEKPKP